MLIEILHVNGDQEDLYEGFHKPEPYIQFIGKLREMLNLAHKAGATIVYNPNLGLGTKDQADFYYTPENIFLTRVPELAKKFPFLQGLEHIPMTILPDGVYIPNRNDELDQLILNEGSGVVFVGGKYQTACVATVARNIANRNPGVKSYIGYDISFLNDFPAERFYRQVPQASVERYIRG